MNARVTTQLRDISTDSYLVWLERYHWVPAVVIAGFCLIVGVLIGGVSGALECVVWGVAVRTVCVWHATWLVNSACHMWGTRRYDTKDRSRNLWWVALLTFGEGWHNNHHAAQYRARHGIAWYEIDLTFVVIRLFAAVGLLRNVK